MEVKSFELKNLRVVVSQFEDTFTVQKYLNNAVVKVVHNLTYNQASDLFTVWSQDKGN